MHFVNKLGIGGKVKNETHFGPVIVACRFSRLHFNEFKLRMSIIFDFAASTKLAEDPLFTSFTSKRTDV